MENLDTLLDRIPGSTAIARDLKLNLRRLLEESSLAGEDGWLALLALATSVGDRELAAFSREKAAQAGSPPEAIQEAAESAAIMAMLNTYYRFRHFTATDEPYRTANLRMTALARPALGKTRFEKLAFAVSVVNGCESCVKAHEKVLLEAGLSHEQIHDLARLAAVVRGLETLRQT